MAGLHKSEFQNPVINWLDSRLPVFTMMQQEYGAFPTPRNFNYFWSFGGLAMVALTVMIITGVVLAMHYVPASDRAFDSVEHIMRDVNYGWLIRYVHMNGASMFFLVVYIHMFRGLYYGSYKSPRELLWMIGVVILLLMMATAFMGYVLPWGQMSYWGATVITNLFSAIPLVGKAIVTWLWGGFSVDNATLNRFYSLHYLLPFVIVGVVFLHVAALHVTGSNNPLGIEPSGPQDTIPFHPYYTIKDMVAVVVFLIAVGGAGVLRARSAGQPGQLHPGQYVGHARAYRAGMVLAAVLCDPALDPQQAVRRHRHVQLDPGPVRAAVARHEPGAQRTVPADLQDLLHPVRHRLRVARHRRGQSARRESGCWWAVSRRPGTSCISS